MKQQLFGVLLIASFMLSVAPMVLATSVGTGINPDINTEDFAPLVWMCDERVVYDDNTQGGRFPTANPNNPQELNERVNNYAFEGEQIACNVLVMDKNGINKVEDVFATIGSVQGAGNDIEVNCVEDLGNTDIDDSCNARILEEDLTTFDDTVMRNYICTFTVETAESMYGQYWITVEAMDLDGLSGTMAENEYWFLNPVIALSIEGDLVFDDVRPGVSAYSETLLVGNDADAGSGILMDMFISGTDFYDSASSGAACPNTNQLLLGDGDSACDVGINFGGASAFNDGNGDPFCYFATSGAYSTQADIRADAEGYVGINYGIVFNNPNPFYGAFNGDTTGYEIMQSGFPVTLPYFSGNI